MVTAIAESAASGGGKPGELRALDGARPPASSASPPRAATTTALAAGRVHHPRPPARFRRRRRWMVITFSTLGDGDPSGEYAATLAGLFDAIMSTLRWT